MLAFYYLQTLVGFFSLCFYARLADAGAASGELLRNGEFESHLNGEWEAKHLTIHRDSDARTGRYALKCSNRDHNNGPSQQVHLQPGRVYYVSFHVKQLNDKHGKLFQSYNIKTALTIQSTGVKQNLAVVTHSSVQSNKGWFRVAGYFRTPNEVFSSSSIKISPEDTEIDFLIDDVSLVMQEDLPHHWTGEADASIQKLRTGTIHFQINLGRHVNPQDITLQIDHKKHKFGFGTMVRDEYMAEPQHSSYREKVYKLFNTATTQGVKWKFDKGTQNHPDYSRATACIDELKRHGMRVRAHNMFWGFEKNLPMYVQQEEHHLNHTIHKHLLYMVNLTLGKADHWDIMNENQHGQWFENKIEDSHFTEYLFQLVHSLDPKPQLMLNDFGVLARSRVTDAYVQQAQRFLRHNIPLHGLGVQAHFHNDTIDPTLIKLNLDLLAKSGLPVWITELDIQHEDVEERANKYLTLLRLFFSHPAVEGVVLWGFWDQDTIYNHSSLVDGDNLHPNAAGRKYLHLLNKVWSTHVNQTLQDGNDFTITGYKGDYDVIVYHRGHPAKNIAFSLDGNSTNVPIIY